jgi:hypothetical protein
MNWNYIVERRNTWNTKKRKPFITPRKQSDYKHGMCETRSNKSPPWKASRSNTEETETGNQETMEPQVQYRGNNKAAEIVDGFSL